MNAAGLAGRLARLSALSWKKPPPHTATGGLRLTGFGHSHLRAFDRAWLARQRSGQQSIHGPDLILSFLGAGDVGDNFTKRQHRRTVAPAFRKFIARMLKTRPPEAVFCVLMGNEYNRLSIVRHPQPFDFDLPGEPPRDPGVAAISAVQMRAQLAHLAAGNALLLWAEIAAQAARTGARIYLLPPPPPIPRADHICAHPGAFGDLVAQYGLNPPALRRKMWLLYCAALRDAVRGTDTTFIELPDVVFADGFLAERFWQGDPTHANGAYGEIMLTLICETAERDLRQ